VILAKEISAELILMDESKGRRFARASGFEVIGCIGILEVLYRMSEISDLGNAYAQLLANKIRIDLPTPQRSLDKFSLPRL
jgi:predicted nucleic acid-binding protein